MADLGLAYIGGIVVGAPVGLLFRAATGLDAALTTTMIVTMAVVLVCCRRRRGHPLTRGFEPGLNRMPGVNGVDDESANKSTVGTKCEARAGRAVT